MCPIHVVSLDDDEDLDEENLPGFSDPSMDAASPFPDKGKGRAPDKLATPSGPSFPNPQLSGNIGSATNDASKPARRTIGGVQVETRYVHAT